MKKKNYELENEFNEWKDKEDQQLRELNYPEDKIATLRKYDHDLFVNLTIYNRVVNKFSIYGYILNH